MKRWDSLLNPFLLEASAWRERGRIGCGEAAEDGDGLLVVFRGLLLGLLNSMVLRRRNVPKITSSTN
jgi:hypothetical protein